MIIKKIILVIVVITFSQSNFSQNPLAAFKSKWKQGKIILKNNDTLIGLVKYESTGKMLALSSSSSETHRLKNILYKASKKSKKRKVKQREIKSFFINKEGKEIKYVFVNVTEKKKKLFQVLQEGKVNLYYRTMVNSTNTGTVQIVGGKIDLFFLKKENEKYPSNDMLPDLFESFEKSASEYFGDCSSVLNKIKNKQYKLKDLKEVVNEYNNCFN